MKISIKFLILLFSMIVPTLCKAQCKVIKEVQSDGSIYYTGTSQTIYANQDLENGIEAVVLQITVIQQQASSNLLKFVFKISEAATQDKPEIIPRILIFTFADGTSLQLNAFGENETKVGARYKLNIDYFKFMMKDYMMFQQNKVISIKIVDDEHNTYLFNNCSNDKICSEDVLIKETNCIANAIN